MDMDMDGLQDSSSIILSAAAASSSSSSSPTAAGIHSFVLYNYPLIAAVVSFAVAQCIKFFIARYKEGHWDATQFFASGGLPSSHSATVAALAVAIGIQEGLDSSLFATATIFASIVMYDATSVRQQAGKQAQVLNRIVVELPEEHPLSDSRPLREPLGHTPFQVAVGGILGFFVAICGNLIRSVAS